MVFYLSFFVLVLHFLQMYSKIKCDPWFKKNTALLLNKESPCFKVIPNFCTLCKNVESEYSLPKIILPVKMSPVLRYQWLYNFVLLHNNALKAFYTSKITEFVTKKKIAKILLGAVFCRITPLVRKIATLLFLLTKMNW